MSDSKFPLSKPDITVSARDTFGVDFDMEIPAFSKASEYVPAIDDAYRFDSRTTQAICAGFCLLYTSPSPRDQRGSRMPSSA